MGASEAVAKSIASSCGCSKTSTNDFDRNTMGKNRKRQYNKKIVNISSNDQIIRTDLVMYQGQIDEVSPNSSNGDELDAIDEQNNSNYLSIKDIQNK